MFVFGTITRDKSLKKSVILSKRLGVVRKMAPTRRKKKPIETAVKRFSGYFLGVALFSFKQFTLIIAVLGCKCL